MTQTHFPAEPEASAGRPVRPVGSAPPVPLSLAYATPQPKSAAEADFGFYSVLVARRLVFALGVGLLFGGLVEAFGNRGGDAATLAGWGSGLVALVVPFRKLTEPMLPSRKD